LQASSYSSLYHQAGRPYITSQQRFPFQVTIINVSTRTPSDDHLPKLAPSLQELPSERSTILELFNINAQCDGTIVEFHALDKQSCRYSVHTLDDEKNLRIKPICRRRPDIKLLA
jgi:hypothetical protein